MSRAWEIAVLSAGGALGVNARYWLATWMSGWAGDRFPWATFAINVSGSFALGLIATFLGPRLPAHPARIFFLVGLLGGYTTFSSFSYEALVLWDRGQHGRSLAYLGGSVVAGFLAVILGVALGRAILRPAAPAVVLLAAEHVQAIDE